MAISIVSALGFAGIVVWFAGRSGKPEKPAQAYDQMWIYLMFAAALFLRIMLGLFAEGYTGDMDTFKAWARITNEVGFGEIYRQNIFLDYPPGYLYVLVLLEKIRLLFDLNASGVLFTLLIKLPAILGDLFCGAALLWLGRRKLSRSRAMLVSGIYLFCPAVLINSSVWGQADSFCLSFLLISVLLLYINRFVPSAAIYGLSIILKPQMLVFAPLFIFYAIRKKRYIMLLAGTLLAVGVILLLATPFTRNFDYYWLFEQYAAALNVYDYYSVNAYNLWALIGLNWAAVPQGAAGILLNLFGPLLATALCGVLMLKAKRDEVLFACPVVLMATVYLFSVRMHERYLFHVLIFLLLAYIFAEDIHILHAFSAVSAVHMLNVSYVLWLYQEKGANYNPNEPVVKVVSALQIAAYFYVLYVLGQVFLRGRIVLPSKPREFQPVLQKEVNTRLGHLDVFALLAITGLYGLLAFYQLGASETALTSWVPQAGDSVVLKAETPVNTLCYISGIAPDTDHYRSRVGSQVSIAVSQDGNTWTDAGTLEADTIDVFKWTLQYLDEPAIYIRLTALDDAVCLNEIGLRDAWSEEYVEITLVSGNGESLVDEQSLVPVTPNYYNSTYFDEIYHARTAYEHIQGLEPYENTHPPLGKLLISLGIRLFGMNPFGWRFMGTLFGILMLPCLYHLLKQLFGSTFLSLIGTLLFAADFMHFTQTRIATIDTYAVFFILLMYDAMVAFLRKDIRRARLRQLMPPLILSGIFMGLGIASKWTVAYGALGLAVLFFAKLICTYRCCPTEEASLLTGKLLRLCGWCCLWFLGIPFFIYFTAFLPMTTLPHNQVFSAFFNYQDTMYSYHTTLTATHPYESPWYEWPVMIKPIWYYYHENPWNPQQVQSISVLGNPALWWPAIPAMITCGILLVRRKARPALVALVGFLSVYLPWVLVSRITFIYHYFTAIPFLIVAIIYVMDAVGDCAFAKRGFTLPIGRQSVSWLRLGICLYAVLNFVLFFAFYPVLSGAETTKDYLEALQWLPQWYFVVN